MFFETVLKAFRNVHLQGVLTGKRVGRYLNGACEAKEICHFFQKKIVDNFGSFEKRTTFALAIGKMMNGCGNNAEIAQLVEHNLAKVRVASSSLVFRSSKKSFIGFFFLFYTRLSFPYLFSGIRFGNRSFYVSLRRNLANEFCI